MIKDGEPWDSLPLFSLDYGGFLRVRKKLFPLLTRVSLGLGVGARLFQKEPEGGIPFPRNRDGLHTSLCFMVHVGRKLGMGSPVPPCDHTLPDLAGRRVLYIMVREIPYHQVGDGRAAGPFGLGSNPWSQCAPFCLHTDTSRCGEQAHRSKLHGVHLCRGSHQDTFNNFSPYFSHVAGNWWLFKHMVLSYDLWSDSPWRQLGNFGLDPPLWFIGNRTIPFLVARDLAPDSSIIQGVGRPLGDS